LRDPNSLTHSKPITKLEEMPDIDFLEWETTSFIEDAYKQYYFIPNQFVPKRERPKWRFVVKRLYKEILLAASQEDDLPVATQLIEKLYQLLCYSCAYILFSGDDPFQSVGIEQPEFFRKVLTLKFQHKGKDESLKGALLLLINTTLNRTTVRSELMKVILEFLSTPDLREVAITKCNELIETIKREPLPKKDWNSSSYKYKKEEKLNILTEMGFLCYAQLFDYEKAIAYLMENYCTSDKEITIHILLSLLFDLKQKDYFLREYEAALNKGIVPRESLVKAYNYAKEKGELPGSYY